VKICTTPPTPSLPYRAEAGPLSTSMRSIMSSGMLSQLGVPAVAEPKRTPSISRMVWRDSVPRMNTLDVLPVAPLALICRPAVRASSSGSVRAVDASIWLALDHHHVADQVVGAGGVACGGDHVFAQGGHLQGRGGLRQRGKAAAKGQTRPTEARQAAHGTQGFSS
jgi:hypothetical protein